MNMAFFKLWKESVYKNFKKFEIKNCEQLLYVLREVNEVKDYFRKGETFTFEISVGISSKFFRIHQIDRSWFDKDNSLRTAYYLRELEKKRYIVFEEEERELLIKNKNIPDVLNFIEFQENM